MDRIRKLNVCKFSCIRQTVTISTDLETKKLQLTVTFFGRCATLSSSDRGINFKEILGHHELHPTPTAFMEDDGYLIPGSDGKSKLMLEVGKDLRVHSLILNENSCHILDAMYIVNKTEPKTQFVKTGSELAAIFTRFVDEITENAKNIILVFDTYRTTSLKNKTQKKEKKR